MRLRLTVCRHELPPAKVLFAVPDEPTSVSKLLELVNDLVPLESADWGLEDYVTESNSYECLHYSDVHHVLKDNEALTIRPVQKPDVLSRRLSGRYQIAANGARLIDGIPFGKQYLRRPARPDVHIPPLKRRRVSEAQEDDIYDEDYFTDHVNPQLRLVPNAVYDGYSQQAAGSQDSTSPSKNGPPSSSMKDGLRSGKPRRNVSFQSNPTTIGEAAGPSDEDEDSDGSDFQPGDDDYSSTGQDSSESEDDDNSSNDADAGAPGNDQEGDGSSNDTSPGSDKNEPSSKSSGDRDKIEPGVKRTDGTNKGESSKQSSVKRKGTSDKSKPSNKSQSPPGQGKKATKMRNQRRKHHKKLSKCFRFAQLALSLTGVGDPDCLDKELLENVESKDPLRRLVRENMEHWPEFEAFVREIVKAGIEHEQFDLFKNYYDRILQLLRKGQLGRARQLMPPPLNKNFVDEPDEHHDIQLKDRKVHLLEQIGTRDIQFGEERERIPWSARKQKQKCNSIEEKVPDEADHSSYKLPRPPPKKRLRAEEHGQDNHFDETATADANTLFDPNDWKQKLVVGVVECRDEDVSLPPPPFPFVKYWWNDGQNPHGAAKKRKRNKRGPKQKKAQHVYQPNGVDTNGDGLQYDETPGGPQYLEWTQEEEALLDGEYANDLEEWDDEVYNNVPDLPENLSELDDLTFEKCQTGMVIVFKRLEVTQSTNWQPAMSPPRTATITSIDTKDKLLFARLARRDRQHPSIEYDEDGHPLYNKFATPQDGLDKGEIDVSFSELVDPKILKSAVGGK